MSFLVYNETTIGDYLEMLGDDTNYTGMELEISGSCNPDFEDWWGADCDLYASEGYCNDEAAKLLFFSNGNDDGLVETGLNCPQCGCDANGAANINDFYVNEDNRKSYDLNSFFRKKIVN